MEFLKRSFHTKRRQEAASAVARPAGCTTFEIISGANLPNLDGGALDGVSDCYALASLVDGDTGSLLAGTHVVRTTTVYDSLDPDWCTYVSFPVSADPGDILKLDLFDEDQLSKDDHIGTALEAVGHLSSQQGAPVVSALAMVTKVKPKDKLPSTVTVRHVSTVAWGRDTVAGGAATRASSPPPPAPTIPSVPMKKTLYLIRHGESKWNEAQAATNVGGMLKQYDHELDRTGIDQARQFNARWKKEAADAETALEEAQEEAQRNSGSEGGGGAQEAPSMDTREVPRGGALGDGGSSRLGEFLSARAVYASPLTRAAETALLTCQGHPHFAGPHGGGGGCGESGEEGSESESESGGRGELRLSRAVREVKSTPFGSLDTIGVKKGHEIAAHVERCLVADGGAELDMEEVMGGINIVPRDATGRWWTSLEQKDTKEMQRVRFRDCFMMLRHDNPSPVVVVVGHSLFFRNLVREHLSDDFKASHPAFAAELSAKKLGNAACLRVEVEWPAVDMDGGDAMAPPSITSAELVFGSGFHEHGHHESGKAAAVDT